MKKNILLTIVVLFSFVGLAKAQPYYMDWDGSGRGEYLCNAKVYTDYWGIAFASGNLLRGSINSDGRFLMINPNSSITSAFVNKLNTNLNKNDNIAFGTNGYVVSNGFQLRNLEADDEKYMSGWGFDSRTGDPTLLCTDDHRLRIGGPGGVHFWGNDKVMQDDNPQVSIVNDGLTVNGRISLSCENSIEYYSGISNDKQNIWIGTTSNHGLYFGTNSGSLLYLDPAQNLFIGVTGAFAKTVKKELKDKYNLFVAQGILSEDYALAPKATWADFVFHENYKLRPISEVEKFIKSNKHLPEVPSAAEVAENGYSQHEVNKALLQKIEELTLYTIQQQKQIDQLLKERESAK